jgi:predicted small secreted protein
MKTVWRIFAFILLCTLMVSCNNTVNQGVAEKIQIGMWAEDAFTNEWSNIEFTLPEGYHIATVNEFYEKTGLTDSNTYNNGNKTIPEDARTVFDILIVGDITKANFKIVYEVGLGTEEMYFEGLLSKLNETPDYQPEVVNNQIVEIGAEQYHMASLYFANKDIYADWYLRENNGAMICLISTYENSDEAKAATSIFINAIQSVN